MVQLGGIAAQMGLSILIVFILPVALLKTTLGLIVAVTVSTPVILGLAIFMAMLGAATIIVLLFLPMLVPLCMAGASIIRYNFAILKAELLSVKEAFGPALLYLSSYFKLCILLLTEAFKVMSVSRETTLFPRDWRVC